MRHIIVNKRLTKQKFDIPKLQPSNIELLNKRNSERLEKGKEILTIPLVLPNNLKKISEHLSLNSGDIAKELGLKTNFILDVMNQNANFSGKSIIKFIKKFNIPFHLLYNINSTITYMEECTELYGCIIKCDDKKELSKVDLIELILSNVDDEYDYNLTLVKKINSDHSINITNEDKKLHYKYHFDLINNLINDTIETIDKNENYYLVTYYKIKKEQVTKLVNLQEHIDVDLINYLESNPFFTYVITDTKIPKEDYIKYDDNTFRLSQSYNIMKGHEIINTDIINSDDCIVEDDYIVIHVCTIKKILLNKFKLLREYKKLSINEMADIFCISPETYLSLEKGHQKLSPYIMWKIEKDFGVLLQHVINIDEYYNFCCVN